MDNSERAQGGAREADAPGKILWEKTGGKFLKKIWSRPSF